MENTDVMSQKPLMVDRLRTRVKVVDTYGGITGYARQRPYLSVSTLFRILSTSQATMLAHNPSPRSRFQEALRQLKADGLLVEPKRKRDRNI
jgi:hypothetical protein